MLDIDITKWGCGLADGYSIKEYSNENVVINYKNKTWSIDYNIDTDAWVYDKYGDFLQRVIEGINRAYHLNAIEDCIEILSNEVLFGINMCNIEDVGIVQAKEQAIKYIWEQVK